MDGHDPQDLYETIASNLKSLRNGYNNGKGISQKELAEKLGIKQQTYAAYENTTIRIALEMVAKIAHFHNVTVYSILNKAESPTAELMELSQRSFSEDELREILSFARYIEHKRNYES